MKLYDRNGYVNIPGVLDTPVPFAFVVGGRGTGKTYGALKCMLERNIKFILLRRTQSQADIISKPEFSPFKRVAMDKDIILAAQPLTKYNSAFYHGELGDDGKIRAVGSPLGYTAALSTFSNVRGFDASDVDLIIYDEFIPETHERPIKNEFEALMNCYETVNRNRELNGQKPVKLLCLANSNDLSNPIFMGLGLVKTAMDMMKKGQEERVDRQRGIGLWILQRSPISDQKEDTALYRLNGNNEFARMSLGNEFSHNAPSKIKSQNLREYVPIVAVGELCVYRHKSKDNYYISTHTSGSPEHYGTGDAELKRFRNLFCWLSRPYLLGRMEFEEYTCEILLTRYLHL